MAKDGTARGGRRPGAGKKKQGEDTLISNLASNISELPEPDELTAQYIPEISSFLKDVQKDGSVTEAESLYKKLYGWLHSLGCEKAVPKDLIERYCQSVARWIQVEQMISKHGFLAMHPTVKSPIASPLVTISFGYLKQAENIWFEIYQIVKERSINIEGLNESDLFMESLLRSRSL